MDTIPIYCSHTELADPVSLVANPRNPNTHSEKQVALLAKIIKAQGWRNPIVVSKRSGFIVKGHCRLAAALKLGVDAVPVDYQDYANEAAEHADMIADNRIAELAEQDDDILKGLLEELSSSELDLDLTGFTSEDINQLLTEGQSAPAQKEDTLGNTEGIQAESQFGVIVMCSTEEEQAATYEKLVAEGFSCKIVTV